MTYRNKRINRRGFLIHAGKNLCALSAPSILNSTSPLSGTLRYEVTEQPKHNKEITGSESGLITLFLCGDVMTGRGIDQILPHPSDPQIHESYLKSAIGYVGLAEKIHGPLPSQVDYSYIWGDALEELFKINPDVRIINLETAVTRSGDYWKDKGINYRMHPDNIPCITAAEIDCCVLANNHVLDWGYNGLEETLRTLGKANVKTAGAGSDINQAQAPAIMEVPEKGRVLIYAFGTPSSGVPRSWAASRCKAGVNYLDDYSSLTIQRIAKMIKQSKRHKDIVVASIHWGRNWGYTIPEEHVGFAHQLIDQAQIDVIHGHSSHHPLGVEVYKNRPILYGCGDFINDYEGIQSHKGYRDDLGLMYFAGIDPMTGKLERFDLTPTRIKRFRVNRTSGDETKWLQQVLNREGKKLGTSVKLKKDQRLQVEW